ncbi:hypothetical protein CVD25_03455 [Bacillus canaveralius]|uniref:Uncharacterized protein n=1 Tax=Bacillus canaveralius TaxID=1403243 RepID=A0A2N5GSB7_9BACI|nr:MULTISPECIES: hypothetical protein [Bacillus]PLR86537.1 hypothetical protein CU635_01050 [Bacillus canaveralius]PLR87834.1 hypothetical protein CVD23_01270 [Bacillus sp. V33-4]PLS00308.1 hypothetical protein CVD25_03455 [Bacillus canaveralius]
MLLTPIRFDENEWFVIITGLGLIFFCKWLKKPLPKLVIVTISMYFFFLGLTVDHIIGADHPFNLYDTMDRSSIDIFDLIVYGWHYPFYGYCFSLIIYQFKPKDLNAVLFVCGWSTLSVTLEVIAVYFSVFQYLRWHQIYSFFTYLLVFGTSYVFIKKLFHSYQSKIAPF